MAEADFLNGLNDIINGAMPSGPDWLTGPTRGLRTLAHKMNPITMIPSMAVDLMNGTFLDNQRTMLGQVARVPTDWAGAIPGLYNLVDKSPVIANKLGSLADANVGSDKPIGLPFAEEASQASDWLHDQGKSIGEFIAGKPLNDSLIHGTDQDLAASWARLGVASLTTIPGAAAKIAQGGQKVADGLEAFGVGGAALAKTGEVALKTLEVMSPIMLVKPGPVAIGLNAAIPSALGVGLETAADALEAKNKEAADKATNVAIQGAETASQGRADIKSVQPQVAGIPSTGDWMLDTAIVGIAGVAFLSSIYRTTAKRIYGGTGKEDTQLGMRTAAASNFQDINAPIKDTYQTVLEQMAHPNVEGATARASNVIDRRTGAAVNTRFESVNWLGEIPESKITITPVNDTHTRISMLTPDQKVKLADYLNAKSEFAFRQQIAEESGNLKLSTPGHYGTPRAESEYMNAIAGGLNESKVAFHGMRDNAGPPLKSANDLLADIHAGLRDPHVRAIADEMSLGVQRFYDYAVEQKNLTRSERLELQKSGQDFYPHLTEDNKAHIGVPLARAGKGMVQQANPIENYPRFLEQVFRRTEGNKTRNNYITLLKDAAARGSPMAKSLIGRENKGGSPFSDSNFVYYRDKNGVPRNIEITDPIVRRALQASDVRSRIHALQGTLGYLAAPTRWSESGATGLAIAAIGQPFSHTAALYSGLIGTITRPHGMNSGYADKLMQETLKLKFGMPGDITGLGAIPVHAAINMGAVMVQRMAQILHTVAVRHGTTLAGANPGHADAFAKALTNLYKRSNLYTMQQEGILGPGAQGAVTQSNALQYAQKTMLDAKTPYYMAKETLYFLSDMLHAISSSPASVMLSLNKGKNKNEVMNYIRNFSGDPGKSGAFQGVAGAPAGVMTVLTPWGNIFIQSSARFLGAAFSKHWNTVAAGLVNGVAMPTIMLSMWTASMPDYIDENGNALNYSEYQWHKRSPDKIANNLYIPLPWAKPENGLEWPIEPIVRPFKTAVELLTAWQLGIMDGSFFAQGNESIRDMFAEMFHSKWLSMGQSTIAGSLVQNSIMPPTPAIANAAFALGGVKLRGYGDAQTIHENREAGFTESTARDPQRTFIGLEQSARGEEIMRALGTSAAYMAYNLISDITKRVGEGQSTKQVALNAKQTLALGSQDATKVVSGLFGSFATISPSQESAGVAVNAKVHGLKQLVAAFDSVVQQGEYTGGAYTGTKQRGYEPLIGGPTAVGAPDAVTLQIAADAKEFYSMLDKQFLGPNKSAYAQLGSIQASTRYSPEAKRILHNLKANEIIENDRAMLQAIQQQELVWSNRYGKHIQLDKMKLKPGMDQFAPNP